MPIIGILTLILWIWEIYSKHDKSDFNYYVKSPFSFVFRSAGNAWAYGVAFATVVTGIYLIFRGENSDLHLRFEAIFSIYFGILVITLAVESLYRRVAPLIGADNLLVEVIKDLNRRRPHHPRVWLVYIAPNIGFYRNYLDDPSVAEDPLSELKQNVFNLFLRALEKAIRTPIKDRCLICYDERWFRSIYEAYDNDLSSKFSLPTEKKSERLSKAEDTAKLIVKIFEDGNRSDGQDTTDATGQATQATLDEGSSAENRVVRIKPGEQFPQSVIVINNVVYFISSYGLPMCLPKNHSESVKEPTSGESSGENNQYEFKVIEAEGELADLISWRREDATLAKTVIAHLTEVRKRINNHEPN
jgi:hypothetical protein